MKWLLIIVSFTVMCLFADTEAGNLEEMIATADAIVEGKFVSKENVKVIDTIKGPLSLSKIKVHNNNDANSSSRNQIIFMKLKKGSFEVIQTVQSDVLIKTRVRDLVMQERIKNSQAVVMAKIIDIQDIAIPEKEDETYQIILCEVIQKYKGSPSATFNIVYKNNRQERPKRLFLFKRLNYIFFLQKDVTSLLKQSDVKNISLLAQKIVAETEVAKHIQKFLSKKLLEIAKICSQTEDKNVQEAFITEFNFVLQKNNFYDAKVFKNITLPKNFLALSREEVNNIILRAAFSDIFVEAIDSYSINYYDGALSDRSYLIKEVVEASSAASEFDDIAGKDQGGLKIIGQVAGNNFAPDTNIFINLLVQNISDTNIEICNSDIVDSLKVHIVDVENNKIVVKGKIVTNKTTTQKNYLTLAPNRYIVTSPLNLKEYASLSTGKYLAYVELEMLGDDKNASWTGKIMTGSLEIIVK